MASGLHTLQGNIYRNLKRCRRHSIPSISCNLERWQSISSISFNAGFLDDTYTEIKKPENVAKTLDLYTLKQKEKGDWRTLTLQEKRALYHISFKQPLCDIEQHSDEWKLILAGTFTAMGLMTLGLYMWVTRFERKNSETLVGPLSLHIDSSNDEMNLHYSKNFSTVSA